MSEKANRLLALFFLNERIFHSLAYEAFERILSLHEVDILPKGIVATEDASYATFKSAFKDSPLRQSMGKGDFDAYGDVLRSIAALQKIDRAIKAIIDPENACIGDKAKRTIKEHLDPHLIGDEFLKKAYQDADALSLSLQSFASGTPREKLMRTHNHESVRGIVIYLAKQPRLFATLRRERPPESLSSLEGLIYEHERFPNSNIKRVAKDFNDTVDEGRKGLDAYKKKLRNASEENTISALEKCKVHVYVPNVGSVYDFIERHTGIQKALIASGYSRFCEKPEKERFSKENIASFSDFW